MSTSSSPPTHDGYIFVCECDAWQRSACRREIFYKQYNYKRYCVLHYPGTDKKEDFQKALKRKISEEDFDFQGVWFPDRVSFRNLTFSADANFIAAQFSASADFRAAKFSAHANFIGAQFSADAYFILAQFNASADFNEAKFSADAYFDDAQFSAHADYGYALFSAGAYFGTARFSAEARFNDAQFGADAYFGYTLFSAGAYFVNVRFGADAYFGYTLFRASASFHNTIFNSNAYFERARFIEKDSSPSRSANSDDKASIINVSFHGARFKDGVTFEENKFAGDALLVFAAAVFEKPERVNFHTVALRPHWFINVDSRKFNFINVDWGALDRRYAVHKEIMLLERGQIVNAPRLLAVTLRQLAVNAEENNRYEEAANFRYMAMDVRRIERGYVENLFSLGWWYWALSGYGERVRRAFVALLVIWLLFALFYWSGSATWWQPKQASRVAAESNAGERQPLTLPDALVYSLGVMTLQKPEPLPANKRAKALVLLETILGPLQAALLALAIRRKFMR